MAGQEITRAQLADLLNEDLSREYQAIIAYVVYSQVLKGAEYMSIAAQLEEHAHQELQHALTISRQIDYLGKMPSVTPKPVKTSDKARDMLKFDLDNENVLGRQPVIEREHARVRVVAQSAAEDVVGLDVAYNAAATMHVEDSGLRLAPSLGGNVSAHAHRPGRIRHRKIARFSDVRRRDLRLG
jgi:bacterioferritin (cytochrome b1)